MNKSFLDLMSVSRREALGYVLNRCHLIGTGVEVGSARGDFARTILSGWEGRRLFLVDPWEKQDPEVYKEGVNETAPWQEWYEDCRRLANEDQRVSLLRMLSVEASKKFSDDFLDFVYIDGNHSARNVLEDLDAWCPKVKIGGLIGGHDFLDRTDNGWFCEVETAVKRWTQEHGFSYIVTPCSSWWLFKSHA